MRWSRFFFASSDLGSPPLPGWVRAANFALAMLAVSLVCWFSFARLTYHLRWDSVSSYREMFLQGWFATIWISALSLVLSTGIGLGAALAQRAPFLPLRYLGKIYIETIRGTPLLVQILFFNFVMAPAFGVKNRYVVGVLTLSFFSGAYIAEIIRAGMESIGRSQLESARAIGLTRRQTYRHVIFPQALRQTLPPLAGQFVSLVKDSSLLSVISIKEFTWNAQSINAMTFSTLESYLPLAAGYLVLTLPISLWTRQMEQRHQFET